MPKSTISHRLVTNVEALVVTVLLFSLLPMGWSCPEGCSCRWKGGKETTECLGNGFSEIPPGIDAGTQVLDMKGNNLQRLSKDVFERHGLFNLQKIYLVNCKLSRIDREAFNRLSNLVELDLSNNLLASIPSEPFLGIPELRRLVLNGNRIPHIEPKAFSPLRSLLTLELSNCQLEVIGDGAFEGLSSIKQLKLNGNKLQTMSSNVLKDIRSLHAIHLEENLWTCDCRSRDLRHWLEASGSSYSISPQCFEPARLKGFDIDKLSFEDFACAPIGDTPYKVVQVEQGDNVTLECKVWADPEAYFLWIWQDNVITNTTTGTITPAMEYVDGRTYLVRESVSDNEKISALVLEMVEERDAGHYTCIAENRGGRFVVNVTLEVISVPVKQQAPLVVQKGFVLGVIIGLAVFALLVLILVCVLIVRFCHSRRHRQRRRQKIPRSETQETKGSSTYDSQNDPLNDKRDLQPVNPIQKPPRSFANATYVSTSEISLHDYSQKNDRVSSICGEPPSGIYNIKPDIIKVDGDDGEYSVPRGPLVNGGGSVSDGDTGNIYQNLGRWSNESPISKCHGCGDHAGSCLGVPCLHTYSADGDAESDRSYRANFRPTASGLAGEMNEYDAEEWPRPPPPLYDTVKQPIAIDGWNPHPSIPPRIEEGYETVEYPRPTGEVWERQSPTTAAIAAAAIGGASAVFPHDNAGPSANPNVHLKNSVSGLSPFPILNLSTVRDSPDEGYEDEGEEGTEV